MPSGIFKLLILTANVVDKSPYSIIPLLYTNLLNSNFVVLTSKVYIFPPALYVYQTINKKLLWLFPKFISKAYGISKDPKIQSVTSFLDSISLLKTPPNFNTVSILVFFVGL